MIVPGSSPIMLTGLCRQRGQIPSLSAATCVVKIILFSCEPEAYSLDRTHLPCMYVRFLVKGRVFWWWIE